jgi:DNA helicase-2/ATP-dependent DNA helicase PcrA
MLIQEKKYSEDDILILLRSDSKQKFSDIIKNALEKEGIAVSNQNQKSPFDENDGRLLLSFLRLINEFNDSLALRTILHLRKNNKIGIGTILKIYNLALQKNKTFLEIIEEIAKNPSILPTYGNRIRNEFEDIKNTVNKYNKDFLNNRESTNISEIKTKIQKLAEDLIKNKNSCKLILDSLFKIIDGTESTNLNIFFTYLNSSLREMEQEREKGKINIITMHKAKGLTAKAVIIVGVEQEFIPGRQKQEPERFDELRLLFVSISRAKHFLALTYCNKRIKEQKYYGSNPGNPQRHLTEFLRNCNMLRAELGEVLLI